MLDAGVRLRDMQIAAHHADPHTTTRYDRARTNLDRHPDYILAAYMASGTWHLNRATLPMRGRRTGFVQPRTARSFRFETARYGFTLANRQ